ncbi:MAG: hypothetical protein HXX08_13635 [Chloroflexi bacterium]|uniref:Uncharacterized protein n=1 Tax=Candidatus Chlorohelix allophototropha TaxID=3003348 RepID=A0A8T7M492_9CHLR|nr:hypothetical protein [Chloroflexota bacterium]WJW70106.1 hypothetical protein OZ401_004609 [Chloroflexota bacterium L227-S17]
MGLLDKFLNRDALQKLSLKQLTKEKEKNSLEVIRLNDQIAALERKKSYFHSLMTDPARNLTDRQRVQVVQDFKALDSQIATLHNALNTVRSYISQMEMVLLQKQTEAIKSPFDQEQMRQALDDRQALSELERQKRLQLNEAMQNAPSNPLDELSGDDLDLLKQFDQERQENARRQQQVETLREKPRTQSQRETE